MPAETPADPTPTSIGLPTTTATDDDAIWQFIRDWVTGHIDLVLRPTWLPSGLDSATVDILANKPDHDTYMARYTGTAGSLWIGAGFLNPPAAMEGTEELVDVRGNQAHLYDASTDDSWVYWQEAGVEPPGRLYVVRGTMGKDAILHVAQSLEPYP